MTIEPFPLYAHTGPPAELWPSLRARYPSGIAPVLLDPHTRGWLLLSWERNKQVFQDPYDIYSVDPGWWRDATNNTVPETSGLRAIYAPRRRNARHVDGQAHQRYRRALETALAGLDQRRLAAEVREAADELIARFAPRGWADAIADYTSQLSALALTRVLGLEEQAGGRACAAMRRLWDGGGGGDALAGGADLYAELLAAAAHQRTQPGEGVITSLIADGHTDEEIADQGSLLVSVTGEPGTHLGTNTLRALLTDPVLRGEVMGARTPITDALELTMARDTPMRTMIGRWPRERHRLGDYTIERGDLLIFCLESAGQDLIDRSGLGDAQGTYIDCDVREFGGRMGAHLGWGVGAHRCPHAGRDIAGIVAEAALDRLLFHLPDVRLAVDSTALVRTQSPTVNGLERLPIRFEPTEITKEAPWPTPARPSSSTPPPATPTSHRTSSPMGRLLRWIFPEG